MSKACKCDRCGKFFEPTNYPTKPVYYVTKTPPGYCTIEYDLCDKCQDDLEEFMEGKK